MKINLLIKTMFVCFAMFFLFASCKMQKDGSKKRPDENGVEENETCLVEYEDENADIATIEVLDENGEKIESGTRYKKKLKLNLRCNLKNYYWQIENWKVNEEDIPDSANKRSIFYMLEKDAKFTIKMAKIQFDESLPNITFKIASKVEMKKDEVRLQLYLLGDKKGEVIQIDWGDGTKQDYTFLS